MYALSKRVFVFLFFKWGTYSIMFATTMILYISHTSVFLSFSTYSGSRAEVAFHYKIVVTIPQVNSSAWLKKKKKKLLDCTIQQWGITPDIYISSQQFSVSQDSNYCMVILFNCRRNREKHFNTWLTLVFDKWMALRSVFSKQSQHCFNIISKISRKMYTIFVLE